MEQLILNPISSLSYFFLALSLCSLWIYKNQMIWLSFLIIANGFFWWANRLSFIGIILEVLFFYLCFLYFNKIMRSFSKFILGLIITFFSLFLSSHLLPGFKNWLVLPDLILSKNAPVYSMYFNFDKAFAGLVLLGLGFQTVKNLKEWKKLIQAILPILLSLVVLMLVLSFLLKYVKIDFKWFHFSWIWLLNNLLFTCMSEEVLFRGMIQGQLTEMNHYIGSKIFFLKNKFFCFYLPYILSSFLFGLFHYRGGLSYILLATVAGLFYGWAYIKTKKIESSIMVHFLFNAIHFIFFTYPSLK